MARIVLLLELAKELAKVTWFIGLAVLAFQLAWIIGSEHVTIHHTLQSLESTAQHADEASIRISNLIGPVESRASEPQTLAHVVSRTAQVEETLATTVTGIQPVVESSRVLIVDLDTSIRHIHDTTIPEVDTQIHSISTSIVPLVDRITDVVASSRPVVASLGSLTTDIQASIDDSYWDAKATLESANVFFTQTAQASQTFNTKFPVMLETFQGTNQSIEHATSVLSDAITRYFKPSPLRDRLLRLLPFFSEAAIVGATVAK